MITCYIKDYLGTQFLMSDEYTPKLLVNDIVINPSYGVLKVTKIQDEQVTCQSFDKCTTVIIHESLLRLVIATGVSVDKSLISYIPTNIIEDYMKVKNQHPDHDYMIKIQTNEGYVITDENDYIIPINTELRTSDYQILDQFDLDNLLVFKDGKLCLLNHDTDSVVVLFDVNYAKQIAKHFTK